MIIRQSPDHVRTCKLVCSITYNLVTAVKRMKKYLLAQCACVFSFRQTYLSDQPVTAFDSVQPMKTLVSNQTLVLGPLSCLGPKLWTVTVRSQHTHRIECILHTQSSEIITEAMLTAISIASEMTFGEVLQAPKK